MLRFKRIELSNTNAMEAGAEEIIVAFDRQFQEIGDEEFKHLKTNLMRLRDKYKNFVLISFIFRQEYDYWI